MPTNVEPILPSSFDQASLAPEKGNGVDPYTDIVGLWCLRILIKVGSFRPTHRSYRTLDDDLMDTIGLQDVDLDELPPADLGRLLRRRLKTLEASRPAMRGPLGTNLEGLARELGLTDAETAMLGFCSLAHRSKPLEDAMDAIVWDPAIDGIARTLSRIIGIREQDAKDALRPEGTLRAGGLIQFETNVLGRTTRQVELLGGLADALMTEQANPFDMFKRFFSPAPAPKLVMADFAHVREDWRLLTRFLRGAMKQRLPGVNILIYGQPGTGKTELVRALAAAVRADLVEVSATVETEEFTKSSDRFGAYLLCQKVLARPRRCLVLFDEIEDVFPDNYHPFFGRTKQSDGKKAFVNGVLESNPVPAFWVSNEVAQIEAAYLRRFDYVLELPAPGPEVRRKILAKYVSDLGVEEQWLDAIARNEHIPPAQIERAARVVATIGTTEKGKSMTPNLERIMNSSLKVIGLPRVDAKAATPLIPYRLDVLNPDCDLEELTGGLKRSGQGRLCLYGPPGTGKTAYGRYLADRLGKLLVLKRASDLLGKYVGDTESNIAAMFAEARDRGAVLMIDEVDSFLCDRTGARHSWEVTLVNELLTQMEDFGGVFVASTNLMEAIDQASLRRFDLKIRFDYMKPDQAWALFRHVLKEGGVKWSRKYLGIRARLSHLNALTPGDFATALRQCQVTGRKLEPDALVEALVRECECGTKCRRGARPIGFTAEV